MSKDAFDAVVSRQVLRELGRAGIAATTTPTTPLGGDDFSAATDDSDDWVPEEVSRPRAVEQARAIFDATNAKVLDQARARHDIVNAGLIASHGEVPAGLARNACKVLVTRGWTSWQSSGVVNVAESLAEIAQRDMTSQVQWFVERLRVEPIGMYDVGGLYTSNINRFCFVPHSSRDPYGTEPHAGVFAIEAAAPSFEWQPAAAAFHRVEPVEQYEARALRLFATLQNGPALANSSVQRLRDLEHAAREEGQPFSLDALEALVTFANAHPKTPRPDFTLSATGGIVAEWRGGTSSVTLYFINPVHVQFLVKQANPFHPTLAERSSGATTVDRVSEALKALSPAAWPIRA